MARPKMQRGTPCLCENCNHFGGDAQSQSAPCRINPPVAIFIGMDAEERPVTMSAWPPVKPNQWCGKHDMVSLIQALN